MIQDLYIVGATGRVGSTLVRQVIEQGDTDPTLHVNLTRIVGLASSTHTFYSPQGISPQQAYDFAQRNYGGSKRYNTLGELLGVVENGHRNGESTLVFVDVTAVNEPMTQFQLDVINSSPHGVVTANKNPVALSDYAAFQTLTQDPRRYGFRCSVMAGAEAVPFLQDLRDLNDPLKTVEGCFSGTLGYICSELEKDRPFSEILKEAHTKGYTEPHPRDDLSGVDVARKLVVLARTAGYPVGIKDVQVKPFIPEEYLSEDNVGRFLGATGTLDHYFHERMGGARTEGNTLRYVAQIHVEGETPKLEVSLQEVPKQGPLGGLEGTLNKIFVVSAAYPGGYSVEAPGAGLEVTARNVRRDLLHLLPERKNRT